MFLLCFTVVSVSTTFAQDDTVDSDEIRLENLTVNIKEFVITGDNPLNQAEIDKTLAPYTGEDQEIEQLQRAQLALTKRLQRRGYSFYRVTALPQELSDGVVTLHIEKYVVENVSVSNNKFFSENNLKNSLPRLMLGESPNTIALSRNLKLVNENPAKQVKISMSRSETPRAMDSELTVTDSKPYLYTLTANNTGSDSTGEFRVGMSVDHYNVFDRDHIASISFTTSPEGVDEVQQYALNYTIPLYSLFAKVTFFTVSSNVDSGLIADAFDVSGSGQVFGMGYKQYLPDAAGYEQSLYFQLSDNLFDNEVDFLGDPIGVDVRTRPALLRYTLHKSSEKITFDLFMQFSNNFDSGSQNNSLSYEATRSGATPDWSVLTFGGNASYRRDSWLYQLNTLFAETSDRLIPAEQFGVGGARRGRGLEERELTGDKGYYVGLQFWAPKLRDGVLWGGFLDCGTIRNNQPTEGEVSSESVTTTGFSLLVKRKRSSFTLLAHLGYVIDGIEVASTNSQDGDVKLHASARKSW